MPQIPLSEYLAHGRRILKTTLMIGGTYYLYVIRFIPADTLRVVKARHFYDMSVVREQNRYIKDKYVAYDSLILLSKSVF